MIIGALSFFGGLAMAILLCILIFGIVDILFGSNYIETLFDRKGRR